MIFTCKEMLREAREEPVGPHMHGHTVSQVPSLAKQARSQTFPRRHQGSNSACSDTPHIAEREWLHQNQFDHQQIKLATRETRLANLETAINKIQKDMQYVKSHVNFCSSSESLSSLSSQQPQECCEDCNNLSAPESYSDFEDFEDFVGTVPISYQSDLDFQSDFQALSDAKYLSLQRVGRGNQLYNSIFKFNSLPGKFVLSK